MAKLKDEEKLLGMPKCYAPKGVNVDGMMRYSYDCPFCDYCLFIYVQPLTGRLVKIERGEKEVKNKNKSPHFQSMEDYEELRHKHIMKEIKALKDAKMKQYNRGNVVINKGKK